MINKFERLYNTLLLLEGTDRGRLISLDRNSHVGDLVVEFSFIVDDVYYKLTFDSEYNYYMLYNTTTPPDNYKNSYYKIDDVYNLISLLVRENETIGGTL